MNLQTPPVTVDLWAALRTRIATAAMEVVLGTKTAQGEVTRVFIEGDYTDPPWAEAEPGGRVVIVPGLALGGTRFRPGFTTPLSFLVRTDFNNYRAPGYNVALSLELAQKEAFKQLQHWTWAVGVGAGGSAKVMLGMAVTMDTTWEPRALYDEGRLGVVFVSSRYRLEVAETPAA